MKPDTIEIEILEGGTVRVTTGKISPSMHSIVEQTLREFLDSLGGGEVAVSRLERSVQEGEATDVDETQSPPRLDFFRTLPPNAEAHPPLVSSFQSLETCFSLIALERYPQALIACAVAIESALKAKFNRMLRKKLKLINGWELSRRQLLDEAKVRSRKLASFDDREVYKFFKARDRFIHHGFSPYDDDESVRLLLETGLPFVRTCYQEFYDFYLDYRDHTSDGWRFEQLSEQELEKVGLPPRTADHLRVAFQVYEKARPIPGRTVKYCISTFAQYIGYLLRSCVKFSDAEHADSHFGIFSPRITREKMEQAVQAMWQVSLDECIEFDCPICGGQQTLIARIDEDCMKAGSVSLQKATCIKCGLSIPKGRPFLADIFLKDQLSARKDEILQKHGNMEGTG